MSQWTQLGPRERELLAVLRRADAPLTARDLLDAVRSRGDEVAYTTVNRSVDGLVETLRSKPTANVGLAKEAIHDSLGQQWRDGLQREAALQSLAYDTPAHEEGVAAFREGRTPEFDR